MHILDIVLPIFLMIALGYVLSFTGFMKAPAVNAFSRFVFYVAAPAILFQGSASASLKEVLHFRSIGVVYLVTIGMALVVYIFTFFLRPDHRGVVAQGSYRSNMVFVGLPVITFAYSQRPELLGPITVIIGLTVPLYNLLAVVVLSLPHCGKENGVGFQRALKDVVLNPLIIASLSGLLFSMLPVTIPLFLDRSLLLVGRIAAPAALIVVGASLELKKLRKDFLGAFIIAFFKLILYPALIYILLRVLGAKEGPSTYSVVLLTASPTAVAAHIMAREMGADETFSAATVMGSTVLSVLTITGWLLYLGI